MAVLQLPCVLQDSPERPQEPWQPEAQFSVVKKQISVFWLFLSAFFFLIFLQQKINADLIFSHLHWTETLEANHG